MTQQAPGRRTFTAEEMQFAAREAANRAERRTVQLEERLARLESRMAEKDQTITALQDGLARSAEAVAAMNVVVKELETKINSVDKAWEHLREQRELITSVQEAVLALDDRRKEGGLNASDKTILRRADAFFDLPVGEMTPTLSELQRKRGPKGSKNKPKVVALSAGGATQAEARANLQAQVDKLKSEGDENAPQDGDSSNPEASEG